MRSSNINKPLIITMGDPAGVGPELVERAWNRRAEMQLAPFCYLADPSVIGHTPTKIIEDPSQTAAVFDQALPILPLQLAVPAVPGRPEPANARIVIQALEIAAALCVSRSAAAMVTAPVSKDSLYGAGFTAPGQTEFLAGQCGVAPEEVVMMLAGPDLKVVPLTIHLPLREVPSALTYDLVLRRARITDQALRRDFKLPAPRLAFCGLNPHAGESGNIGTEEQDILIPAIAQLRSEGINAQGPFPADTMFHEEARAAYDVALSAYHDQGLIPLKTLSFFDGVNVTLGLPILRTSPDHGTAFDIAGQGKADARSMIAALQMAAQIATARHGG